MLYALYALAFYTLGAATAHFITDYVRRRVEKYIAAEKKQKKEEFNFYG